MVGGGWDPSSSAAWFGTDQIGRDMFTRLIYGARMTIGIAFVTTILSFFFGITFGLIAAVAGKWVDVVLSRLVDVVLSIPLLIWALMILNVLGQSLFSLVLTIAFLDSTRVFRLARAIGISLVSLDFVEVARMRGEGLWWIVGREILPNAAAPLMSEFGLRFCFNFLFIAALSFLGLGVPLPYADWGGMVKDNVGGHLLRSARRRSTRPGPSRCSPSASISWSTGSCPSTRARRARRPKCREATWLATN